LRFVKLVCPFSWLGLWFRDRRWGWYVMWKDVCMLSRWKRRTVDRADKARHQNLGFKHSATSVDSVAGQPLGLRSCRETVAAVGFWAVEARGASRSGCRVAKRCRRILLNGCHRHAKDGVARWVSGTEDGVSAVRLLCSCYSAPKLWPLVIERLFRSFLKN